MSDKERLALIKERHQEKVELNDLFTVSFIHAEWLIELAGKYLEEKGNNSETKIQ